VLITFRKKGRIKHTKVKPQIGANVYVLFSSSSTRTVYVISKAFKFKIIQTTRNELNDREFSSGDNYLSYGTTGN